MAKPIKGKFKPSTNAESEFFRALKKVAKYSSHIIDAHVVNGSFLRNELAMQKALEDYSTLITPWATRQSQKLLEKVSKSNKRAYKKNSKVMGQLLKTDVAESAAGRAALDIMMEQVALIKSIPIEAGLRAQKIAEESFFNGTRAVVDPSIVDQLQKQMGMTEEVAVNRARLIARTETARANSAFVQARAQAVGVTSYVWRTSMDGAERKSHGEMNGEIVRYDEMPTLSDGTKGHAGQFPNCRCYQDPILPDL